MGGSAATSIVFYRNLSCSVNFLPYVIAAKAEDRI
jgi:hypothetical protein